MTKIDHELGLLQFLVEGHDFLDKDLISLFDVTEFHVAQEDIIDDTVDIPVA